MTQRSPRGSVLILIPVVLLVLFILGAISVDAAVEYLGHRQLQDFTASTADQAAAAALDKRAFYLQAGSVSAQQGVVDAVVRQAARDEHAGGLTITNVHAELSDQDRTVTVSASGLVRMVFGPATRGRRIVRVFAQSSAVIAQVRRTS